MPRRAETCQQKHSFGRSVVTKGSSREAQHGARCSSGAGGRGWQQLDTLPAPARLQLCQRLPCVMPRQHPASLIYTRDHEKNEVFYWIKPPLGTSARGPKDQDLQTSNEPTQALGSQPDPLHAHAQDVHVRALQGLRPQRSLCTVCTRTELEPGQWLDGHQQNPSQQEPRPALRLEGHRSSALPCRPWPRCAGTRGRSCRTLPRLGTAAQCSSGRGGHRHGTSVLGGSMVCTARRLPGGSTCCHHPQEGKQNSSHGSPVLHPE